MNEQQEQARSGAAMYVLGKLSERECEVFKRVALGHTLTEIATSMGITRSAVSTYRRRVLLKLRQSTNADLTMLADRLGIINAPDFDTTPLTHT